MALSAIITKRTVTNPQSKLFIISVNLKIMDNAIEVINQDFSCEYRTGESIPTKANEIKEKMQEVIDKYKASQLIFNNAQLDTVVTQIQGGLIL